MTAKEARELAEKQIKVLNAEHKGEFDSIMTRITAQIEKDATVSCIYTSSLSKVVKTKLEDKENQYTVTYSPGDPKDPRESGIYKISWNQYE